MSEVTETERACDYLCSALSILKTEDNRDDNTKNRLAVNL